jgi:hypothetical protein
VQHRDRSIETLLGVGAAGDFEVHEPELVPVVIGLCNDIAAADSEQQHPGQTHVACEHGDPRPAVVSIVVRSSARTPISCQERARDYDVRMRELAILSIHPTRTVPGQP